MPNEQRGFFTVRLLNADHPRITVLVASDPNFASDLDKHVLSATLAQQFDDAVNAVALRDRRQINLNPTDVFSDGRRIASGLERVDTRSVPVSR